MVDMRATGTVKTPGRGTSDGGQTNIRGTRDGVLFTASYYESLAMQGRIQVVNNGSVTTPLTFLVTAANRPDAWLRVPDGTAIIPITVTVALEAFAGTVTEIDLRIAQNDIGNGTSSAATVGPLGTRTDVPFTSGVTARQLATGDTTAETNPISLWRRTIPAASAAGNDGASGITITREMMGYPIIVGASTIELFIAATTTQATGFVVWTFAEIPETDLV